MRADRVDHGAAIVRRIAGQDHACYLTFDDGPHPEWTTRVLDALAQADAHATFFVLGRLASRFPSLLRRARALGHEIGNHSYEHRHPWTLTRSRACRDIRDGADAIAQATGEYPQWYRPPHGRLGAFVLEAAREHGQRVVLWSISAVDWGPFVAPRTILARLASLQGGDIALLHDGPLHHNHPERTLGALPTLLDRLRRAGLTSRSLPSPSTMRA